MAVMRFAANLSIKSFTLVTLHILYGQSTLLAIDPRIDTVVEARLGEQLNMQWGQSVLFARDNLRHNE